MDIITQRFIAISNKILAELRHLVSVLQEQKDAASDADQAQEKQYGPPPEVRAILDAPEGIETKKSRPDAEAEKGHQSQTLLVQWALCFVTACAFGAAAYYACIARRQWITTNKTYDEIKKQTSYSNTAAEAAKSAAKTAAVQLELTQRPWISIDTRIIGPLTVETGVESLPLEYIFKNSGNSPAVGLDVESEIYFPDPRHYDIRTERERLCKEAVEVTSRHTEETLFPGRERVANISVTAKVSDIANRKYMDGVVIVCIAYRPTFNKGAMYYTASAYTVQKINPTHRGFFAINVGESVPLESLSLQEFWVAATIAK